MQYGNIMQITRSHAYEDDLYYPFYINHMFIELRGKDIKAHARNEHVMLTRQQFDDIQFRLARLEEIIDI